MFQSRLQAADRELVESVDILSLATTATTPIINADWVKAGLHINGIGSHAVGVRELDTATVVKSKLVCDQVDACLAEAGRHPDTHRGRRTES